jgi:hypothetical protein
MRKTRHTGAEIRDKRRNESSTVTFRREEQTSLFCLFVRFV